MDGRSGDCAEVVAEHLGKRCVSFVKMQCSLTLGTEMRYLSKCTINSTQLWQKNNKVIELGPWLELRTPIPSYFIDLIVL